MIDDSGPGDLEDESELDPSKYMENMSGDIDDEMEEVVMEEEEEEVEEEEEEEEEEDDDEIPSRYARPDSFTIPIGGVWRPGDEGEVRWGTIATESEYQEGLRTEEEGDDASVVAARDPVFSRQHALCPVLC